jgi:hypothetical protein
VIDLPWPGTWTLTLGATRTSGWWGFPPEGEPYGPFITLRDPASGTYATLNPGAERFRDPDEASITLHLPAGRHTLSVEVTTSGHEAALLDAITATGVPDDPSLLASHLALPTCGPDLGRCAITWLSPIARRAWRRPPTGAELAQLVRVVAVEVAGGASVDDALRAGLVAILASPSFLYRVELDDGAASPHPLTTWEVSARLAAFLWNSVPDDTLLDCAEHGLGPQDPGPCGLRAQVDRMIEDPRSSRMIERFATGWLQVGAVPDATRDPEKWPTFDAALGASMLEGTRRTVRDLAREEHPLRAWWDAPATWINDDLAPLYGVTMPDQVDEDGFARVDLPDGSLRGVLRQAAFLTATSQATRTSVVQRGVWILAHALCAPPGAPPAVATPASLDEAGGLDAHEMPGCASCDDAIDPWGLMLEGYDAIGAARPATVETALPDGTALHSAADGARWLSEHDEVRRCVGEHIATWALARSIGPLDEGALQGLHQAVGPDATFLDYARKIPFLPAFLHRAVTP